MWQFFPLKKRCLSKIKPTSYQCLYSIPSSLWQTMHQVKKKNKIGLIEFMLCNVCVRVYVNKLEPLCRDHFLSMLMLCSQVCLVLFLYLPFREIMLWEVFLLGFTGKSWPYFMIPVASNKGLEHWYFKAVLHCVFHTVKVFCLSCFESVLPVTPVISNGDLKQ